MGAGDACAMGILTLNHVENCLSITANQVLCGLEIAVGLLILFLLLREVRRVFALLQMIIVLHCCQICCVIGVSIVSLADADPTIEGTYVLFSLVHLFFVFAVSGRLFVLARVVYMSASLQKRVARAQTTWKLAVLLFGLASVFSIINIILWMFTPLFATPGTSDYENFHRIGFVVFGTYLTCIAIGLAGVSRYVINLYVGLQADSDSNETRKRQRGAAILRQMTISTVTSQLLAGLLNVILGAIPGALRNEVAHIVFFLSQFALLSLVPFVRKTAEIRANNQETQRLEMERKGTAAQTRTTSRSSQTEPRRMVKSPSSLSSASQADPPEAPGVQEPTTPILALAATTDASATLPIPIIPTVIPPTATTVAAISTDSSLSDSPVVSSTTPASSSSSSSSSPSSSSSSSSSSSEPVGVIDRLRAISLRSRQPSQIAQLQQAEGGSGADAQPLEEEAEGEGLP